MVLNPIWGDNIEKLKLCRVVLPGWIVTHQHFCNDSPDERGSGDTCLHWLEQPAPQHGPHTDKLGGHRSHPRPTKTKAACFCLSSSHRFHFHFFRFYCSKLPQAGTHQRINFLAAASLMRGSMLWSLKQTEVWILLFRHWCQRKTSTIIEFACLWRLWVACWATPGRIPCLSPRNHAADPKDAYTEHLSVQELLLSSRKFSNHVGVRSCPEGFSNQSRQWVLAWL